MKVIKNGWLPFRDISRYQSDAIDWYLFKEFEIVARMKYKIDNINYWKYIEHNE
jgi:hypothetical protein